MIFYDKHVLFLPNKMLLNGLIGKNHCQTSRINSIKNSNALHKFLNINQVHKGYIKSKILYPYMYQIQIVIYYT